MDRITYLEWLAYYFFFWLRPSRLLTTGLSPLGLNFWLALGFTWGVYFCANTWYLSQIEECYNSACLTRFKDVISKEEAARKCIQLKWGTAKIRGWLEKVMEKPSPTFTAKDQCHAFFSRNLSQEPKAESDRRKVLFKAQVTGLPDPESQLPLLRRARMGLWIVLESHSAETICGQQFELYQKRWLKANTNERSDKEQSDVADNEQLDKEQFIKKYIQAMQSEIQGPIREMRRINGWVQWLTIFTTALLCITGLRRLLLVTRLRLNAAWVIRKIPEWDKVNNERDRWIPKSNEMYAVLIKGLVSDDVSDLKQSVDNGPYAVLFNLVAVLPAFGFIGTVLGLGEALLKADGLFNQDEKQSVIGEITHNLGFAYDATLISLICAPVAGVLLAYVRGREHRMFMVWNHVRDLLKLNPNKV